MTMKTRACLYPLEKKHSPNGSVYRALRSTDQDFVGFGEAYFSEIHPNSVKGWKRHKKMTCNLVVPIGSVGFVVTEDFQNFDEFYLSNDCYARLVIGPLVWFAFKGLSRETSLLLNVADLVHDACEHEIREFDSKPYKWKRNN